MERDLTSIRGERADSRESLSPLPEVDQIRTLFPIAPEIDPVLAGLEAPPHADARTLPELYGRSAMILIESESAALLRLLERRRL